MKVKYLHHSEEWLAGDYEAPPGVSNGKSHFSVWRVHPQFGTERVGMKVHGMGTGVWDAAGHLLAALQHYIDCGADLAWHPVSGQLVSLEASRAPSQSPGSLEAFIRLRGGSAFDVQGEFKLTFPTGGMKYLVPSPDFKVCAATWLDVARGRHELAASRGGLATTECTNVRGRA